MPVVEAGVPVAQSEFDDFCRFAFAFLDDRGTRYLVVDGLAVIVVGEPRTTADADAVVFVSMAEAEVLIRQAAEAGFEVREDVERPWAHGIACGGCSTL